MKLHLLIIPVLLLSMCISINDHHASVTETDTGEITGFVIDQNGGGINAATVILRNQDRIQTPSLGKILSSAVRSFAGKQFDTTTTLTTGAFTFVSVDTGRFLLEIRAGSAVGAIAQATVTLSDPTVTVGNVTVDSVGSITGTIAPSGLIDLSAPFIYIRELALSVPVGIDGTFDVPGLPRWTYDLRLYDGDSIVASALDTMKIAIDDTKPVVLTDIGIRTGSVNIDGTVQER
jgi:hypothetical protein